MNLDAISAFENAKNVKDFLLVVSAFSDKPMIDNETAIFIDEIQMVKEIDFLQLLKGWQRKLNIDLFDCSQKIIYFNFIF